MARRGFRPSRPHVYSKLAFVLLLAALIGCARDVANRYYGGVAYPAKEPREVEVLWRAPTRNYVVIADFQSRNETPDDMREKAAKIGADAVIISILGGPILPERGVGGV
jgi:hypothetical protein